MTAAPGPHRFCPSCHQEVEQFGPGPSGRPDATCPRCGALERHRFLSVVLDGLAPWLAMADVVLDVAPSRHMTPQLRRLCPRGYFSADFDPAADGRAVDLRASLTHLPLPDASVDLVVCYHVLEHVPDDRAAMRELARVLRASGLAVVQVPWRGGSETDEDPAAPAAERVRRFGQADHVRHYGRDFEDRLRASGLDVVRFTPLGVLGQRGCDLMRLSPREAVWLVRPSAGPQGRLLPAEGLTGGSVDAVVGLAVQARSRLEVVEAELQRLEAELAQVHRDGRRWEQLYRSLRGRTPVRAMVAASRLLKPVSAKVRSAAQPRRALR